MKQSSILFREAKEYIPGGVNSPVRAFNGVGGNPVFFERGEGAYLFDVDGNSYIDYVGSWGPMILGHSNPVIIDAVKAVLDKGLGFGAPTEIETSLAKKVCQIMPSIELVRMVSSGTEATMSAVRLARGYTNRDKILKFEGCYHGHADSLLVKAGSGALTFGQPSSAGVPKDVAKDTSTLPYNDSKLLEEYFSKYGNHLACVIIEPIVGNMNLIVPELIFLKTLRNLCTKFGVVLIFDEVMTGFRVSLGGAQELYGITPDMTTLGKIIGGGLPVGAFGGKKEIMEILAPKGPVYQAGTLSGNPVAVSAGLKTLELIQAPGFYEALNDNTTKLMDGMTAVAKSAGIEFCARNVGGMFGLYFSKTPPNSFEEVMKSNRQNFKKFFHLMLEKGIYFGPSAFEAGFVSAAHSEDDIEFTLNAAKQSFENL